MAWTEEMKATLRRLAAARAQAAEIADELGGGITKNAVISAARRYKVALIGYGGGPRPAVAVSRNRSAVVTRSSARPLPIVPCKWPIGEKRPFTECGDPSLPGKPYCGPHARIAYRRD